jgi:putative oxidoreductase
MTVAADTGTPTHRVRSRKNIALTVAQILLAVVFLVAAIAKLTGQPSTVQMFADIGAGQWLRYLVGITEAAGAFGLLVPRLTAFAALGLAAEMAGATVINLAVLHSGAAVLTIPLCVGLALLAHSCWAGTRRSGGRPIASSTGEIPR